MRTTNATSKALGAILVAVVALTGMSGTALAQSGGNQRFILVYAGPYTAEGGAPGRVVAFGPITGAGDIVDESFEVDEETGTFTVVSRLVFPEGDVVLTGKGEEDFFTFDPRTCVGRSRFSGTFEVTGGTGAFEGATGSGTFTGRSTFIADRDPETGECSEESGRDFNVARLRGDVSLADEVQAA